MQLIAAIVSVVKVMQSSVQLAPISDQGKGNVRRISFLKLTLIQ